MKTGKDRKAEGAETCRLGLPGPPPPPPRTLRHPRAPATTYRASDASDVLTRPAEASTALATPCGVPEAKNAGRNGGPRARARAPGAGPSASHALRTRPASTRSGTLIGAANHSPDFGVSTNAQPGRAKRAHPLVPSWPREAGSSLGARPLSPSALAAHIPVFRASGVVRGRVVWDSPEGWMRWGAFSLIVGHTLSHAFLHSFCSWRASVFQARHCQGGGPTVLVCVYILI